MESRSDLLRPHSRPARYGRIGLSIVALIVLGAWVNAQTRPRRIEDASFVTIGGIEQWITIRGEDRKFFSVTTVGS